MCTLAVGLAAVTYCTWRPCGDEPVSRSLDLPGRLTVGVVLERRPSSHPWQDHVWNSVEVVVGGLPAAPWTILWRDRDAARFFAGNLDIELFRKDTEGYKRNLSCEVPLVYVILRQSEGAAEMAPFLATVCPYEAEAYMVSGDERVDGVPMPPEVADLLQRWVERHHIDEPFIKRRQKPKDPGAFVRTPRPAEGGDGG